VVFIPFQKADMSVSTEKIDDTELLTKLHVAGDAVSLFIKLSRSFNTHNHLRSATNEKIEAKFKDNDLLVSLRVKRTYTVLLTFTLLVRTGMDAWYYSNLSTACRVQLSWTF
jgi:hypothetical protein